MACVYWIRKPEHTDIFKEGYVGFSSRTAENRYYNHKSEAKLGNTGYHVHNAINKYGDQLVLETIVEGSNEYCLEVENKLRPERNIGWNIAIGGERGRLGSVASEETRKKQSLAKLGKPISPETRAKISQYQKTRVIPKEVGDKISATKTGVKFSKEHCEAISRAQKGKKQSPERIAKVNEVKLKNPWLFSKRKSTWALAEQIHSIIERGGRNVDVANELNLDKWTVRSLFLKIKAGWNPLTDDAYQTWLSEYRQKESADVT